MLGVLAVLAGCGPREPVLQGTRIDVRDSVGAANAADAGANGLAAGADSAAAADATAKLLPIKLPPAISLDQWPQKSANDRHLPPNLILAASPVRLWSASIGAGDSRKYRISADPVVADGRIFTLDARSHVMAHSTDGAALWTTDLTPASERNKDATGGGLATGGGMVFATTGFGTLVALDPATGAQLWTQRTLAEITGAPTYADGLVYVVSRDNTAWAIRAKDGRTQWQLPGTPSLTGLIGGAAPALTDRLVIFPLSSSDLTAALRKSGIRVWGATIAGERRGRVYATVTDVTGDPVVDGNVIYAATQSGRTVALKAASGDRIWTAEDGAYSPVLPAGGSVFLVSDEARLERLDATTGKRIWAVDLPYFLKKKPKRRKSVHAHYGPVLAGGRLVVASDDGKVRFFSPTDGTLLATLDLPGGATTNPVIVDGTLYLVSGKGKLQAFR